MEFINIYLDILLHCFQYDIHVFSQAWIYYTVVPVIFYAWFFMLKWLFLTLPVCLPIYIIMLTVIDVRDIFYEKRMLMKEKEKLKEKYKSGGLKHDDI